MFDDLDPEMVAWLRQRADDLRAKWATSRIVTSEASKAIRSELETLRQIDYQLPFMVLTVLLEHELQQDWPTPNSKE